MEPYLETKLVDESYSSNKRLMMSSQFASVDIRSQPDRPCPKITPGSHEIPKV
jgi:hypothetical protein